MKEKKVFPDVMTINEVAEFLQIRPRTAYRLVGEGKIPGVKIGGQWRFKKEIIEKMFEKGGM